MFAVGRNRKAVVGGALTYLMCSTAAVAMCPGVVANGETEVTTQVVGSGSSCEVQLGGTIATNSLTVPAIRGTDNNTVIIDGIILTDQNSSLGVFLANGNTITNSGLIDTIGDASAAVYVDDNNTVTNTGTLITDGAFSDAIAVGNGNVISNSGTITTTNFFGFSSGIEAGDNNVIHNTGTISTIGFASNQINIGNNNKVINDGLLTTGLDEPFWGVSGGDNNTVTNNGMIDGNGIRRRGMVLRTGNMVTNTGTISFTGGGAVGVDLFGNNNLLSNTGTILVTGDGATGVLSESTGNLVANSGSIRSTSLVLYDVYDDGTEFETSTAIKMGQGAVTNSGLLEGVRAIDFTGTGDDTLTLLPGSVLIGDLILGAGSDTVNILTGAGTTLSFDSFPEVINTGGLPFVTSGTTVVVLNPAAFSLDSALGGNLTNSIHDPVLDHLSESDVSRPSVTRPTAHRLNAADAPELRFWGKLNVAAHKTGSAATLGDSSYTDFGGILGVDAYSSTNGRVGFFGGLNRADLDVSQIGLPGHSLGVENYFAGVYAGFEGQNGFARFSLSAGRSNTSSTRGILNNAAPGGIETARASYASTLISPALEFGQSVTFVGHNLDLSGKLSYTHILQDGYTETGATSAATVQDRNISLWQARAQVAYPIVGEHGVFTPRLGVAARSTGSNTVAGTVLGQGFGFSTDNDTDLTAFAGFNASIRLSERANLVFDAEFHGNRDGLVDFGAQFGLGFRF